MNRYQAPDERLPTRRAKCWNTVPVVELSLFKYSSGEMVCVSEWVSVWICVRESGKAK